jgi:hypothetical protein
MSRRQTARPTGFALMLRSAFLAVKGTLARGTRKRDNCLVENPQRVELKISISADQVKAARKQLGLKHGDATAAKIWFCERPVVGDSGRLDLFERGLIVRLRSKDGDHSDTTVKYRRPEPIELPAGWDDPDAHPNYKIEGDWTGDNRQVSASLDSTVAHTVIEYAVAKGTPLDRKLFSADQRRFASAIADPHKVSLASLQALGPVHALRWQETSRPDLGDELGAEQWTADDLVFLELSIRVKYRDAKAWQHRFADWATDQGVAPSALATTKTQAVLEHFAKRRKR